jgi:hypothetical protein
LVSGKGSCWRPIMVGMATPPARRMPAKSSDFHLAPLHKLLYTAARKITRCRYFSARAPELDKAERFYAWQAVRVRRRVMARERCWKVKRNNQIP